VGKATFANQNTNMGNLNGIGGPANLNPAFIQSPSSPAGTPGHTPGGGAPTVYSGPTGTGSTGSGQIGFGSDLSKPEQPAVGQNNSRGVAYAMRAATFAGSAMGGLAGMVAGAVPGGSHVANIIDKSATGGLRAAVMTGSIFGQAIKKYATDPTMSFGQSLKDVTGVKEDGMKGVVQAVGRVGTASVKSAHDEKSGMDQLKAYQQPQPDSTSQKPKQPIGFRKGLV
jgi:hypothetical protein